MPRRSPFTLLCQAMAKLAYPKLADLHAHTTASDGDYTPSQLVVHAHNANLKALAITDHDTTNGIAEAIATAASFTSRTIEIIPGAEISTEHDGRDYHLLAYFINGDAPALKSGLAASRDRRRVRFAEFLATFERLNVSIPEHLTAPCRKVDISLGRRHLAGLLVAAGHVATHREAFQKFILPNNAKTNHRSPLADAIQWVHAAGGVTSLAHPPSDFTFENVKALADLGLDAVEANHPSTGYGFSEDLKSWAKSLNLLTTGGSDCHGPEPTRPVGCRTVSMDDLEALRRRAGRSG
ncbi:PHP domain-containing protein [soil metagenome]